MSLADNKVEVLYGLENVELHKGCKFSSVETIQSYVDSLTNTPFWRNQRIKNLPKDLSIFDWGDNFHSEAKSPNEIWLSRQHWTQQVVLHEMAHFLAPTGHGPKFVRAYLSLLEAFMGTEHARMYRAAFKREGIKF